MLMGLLDPNSPEVPQGLLQGLMLLTGRQGQLPQLLGQIMAQNEAQKRTALQAEEQRRLTEAHAANMDLQRRGLLDQQATRDLAKSAYAPNQNLVNFDDSGYAMPSSGGGGDAAFAQGMMGI